MIKELAVVVDALRQVQQILAADGMKEPVTRQLSQVVNNEEVERALRSLSAATTDGTEEQRSITPRTVAAS